jgi:hypothetical protein
VIAAEYDIVTRSYTVAVFGPPYNPVVFHEETRGGMSVGVGRTRNTIVARWFSEREDFEVTPDPVERNLDLPLPPSFPNRAALVGAGITTLAELTSATDDHLLSIKGVGPVAVRAIRLELGRLRTNASRTKRRGWFLDPHEATQAVVDAVRAYATAGVPVFLQDGVLLGAVREGRPLAHDRDVDLGVMHERWRPEADAAMLAAGFTNTGNYNTPDDHYHQKFQRDRVRFCVFHYYRLPDGRIYHGIRRKDRMFVYPREFEIREYPLLGELVPAPHPPEEWLEVKYGPDWRTPVTMWDCRRNPSNSERVE